MTTRKDVEAMFKGTCGEDVVQALLSDIDTLREALQLHTEIGGKRYITEKDMHAAFRGLTRKVKKALAQTERWSK